MKRLTAITIASMMVLMAVFIMLPPAASDGGGGARGADILVVQDGVINGNNGETIMQLLNALSAGGFSYQYVPSESALPSGWYDVNTYPSIFWIGGEYSYKPFGYNWYSERPSNYNTGLLATYVQQGGNVLSTGNTIAYTGHYSGSTEPLYFNWVLHYYIGYQWGGGMGGSVSNTYSTYITDYTHEIWLNPNLISSPFTYTYNSPGRIVCWGSPNGLLNNGQMIARGNTNYADVVAWDGTQYGPYGRTVFVNRLICYQWDMTNRGDILTPFIQNVATWFGTPGIPADVRLEPQSLNLDSNGNYISFKVEGFPENPEYGPMDVDVGSVIVQGVGADLKYGTLNNNHAIGKCDRLLVEDAIGSPGEEVEVDVSGKLNDGTAFVGTAVIKAL
jgi:hypothetical protein